MPILARRLPGRLSAASGAVWFVVFAVLIVATLSYKGIGVIKYPAEAAKWPVVGPWLATPPVEDVLAEEPAPDDPMQVLEFDLQKAKNDHSQAETRERAALVQVQEKETEIAALTEENTRLQSLLNQHTEAQKTAVAKIYERMSATDAVKILEGLLPERAAIILGGMSPTTAAEVLAKMEPSKAQLLTNLMAGFDQPTPQPLAIEVPPQPATVLGGETAVQPATPADATKPVEGAVADGTATVG